jgi:hypothetical protein
MKKESNNNKYVPHICEPAHDIFTRPEVYATYEAFRKKYIGHEITGQDCPDIVRERAGELVTYTGNQPAFSVITTDGRYMVHIRTAPMNSVRPLDVAQRYFVVIGDIESGEDAEYLVTKEDYAKNYGTTTWNRYLQREPTLGTTDLRISTDAPRLEYINQRFLLYLPGEQNGMGFYQVAHVWNDLERLAMVHTQEMFAAESEELIA